MGPWGDPPCSARRGAARPQAAGAPFHWGPAGGVPAGGAPPGCPGPARGRRLRGPRRARGADPGGCPGQGPVAAAGVRAPPVRPGRPQRQFLVGEDERVAAHRRRRRRAGAPLRVGVPAGGHPVAGRLPHLAEVAACGLGAGGALLGQALPQQARRQGGCLPPPAGGAAPLEAPPRPHDADAFLGQVAKAPGQGVAGQPAVEGDAGQAGRARPRPRTLAAVAKVQPPPAGLAPDLQQDAPLPSPAAGRDPPIGGLPREGDAGDQSGDPRGAVPSGTGPASGGHGQDAPGVLTERILLAGASSPAPADPAPASASPAAPSPWEQPPSRESPEREDFCASDSPS